MKYYKNEKEAKNNYDEYIKGHTKNVKEAFDLLCTLDIPYINDNKDTLNEIILKHDESKWEDEEYYPYLHHFYPTCEEDSLKTEEFEEACRHHIKNNKHHWDFWVEDDKLINSIDESEYKLYTVERLCDHMAMSIQNDNTPSDWYFANKEYIIMPDYGYNLYEEILDKIPSDYDLSFHGTRSKNNKPERISESVSTDAVDGAKSVAYVLMSRHPKYITLDSIHFLSTRWTAGDDGDVNEKYTDEVINNVKKILVKNGYKFNEDTDSLVNEGVGPSKEYLKKNFKKVKFNSNNSAAVIVESTNEDIITIYRSVIADDKKQADKYINSTKRYSASDFGPGIYWTKDPEIAKYYGNFLYKAEVPVNKVKKFVDSQDIVILSADVHKSLSKELIDFRDAGMNARYTFHPKCWKENINESYDKLEPKIDGAKLVESANLKEYSFAEDVTVRELDSNPVKLSTYFTDPYGQNQHFEHDFPNLSSLFKYVNECGGFRQLTDNGKIKYFIISNYKDSEFYLIRNKYHRGGWEWQDSNGHTVEYTSKTFRNNINESYLYIDTPESEKIIDKSLVVETSIVNKDKYIFDNQIPHYDLTPQQRYKYMFHNTSNSNISNINREGLVIGHNSSGYTDKSEEGIWCDDNCPTSFGYGGCTITFKVTEDEANKCKVNNSQYLFHRNIPREDIIFIDPVIDSQLKIKVSNLPEFINKYGIDKVKDILIKRNSISEEELNNIISRMKEMNLIESFKVVKDKNKYLLEASMSQLKRKTLTQDPTRVKKSKHVQSKYIGISKYGVLNFMTSSETHSGVKWYQEVQFPSFTGFMNIVENGDVIEAEDVKKAMMSDNIKITCDDPSFLYWAWKYLATRDQYGLEKENRAPKRNNTRLQGALCFTGNTEVLTSKGFKKIKNIIIGDEVFSHTGRLNKVTDIGSREAEIWKVHEGKCIIETTKEHPFLIENGTWSEVQNLKTNNKLVSPILTLPNEVILPKDYAFMLGLYLSDGTARLKYYNHSVLKSKYNIIDNTKVFKSIDIAIDKRFLDVYCELMSNTSFDYKISESNENNNGYIHISGTNDINLDLINFIYENGGLNHLDKYTKFITKDILKWSYKDKMDFVAGFFLGDGSFSLSGTDSLRFNICNSNKQIIDTIFILLSSMTKNVRYNTSFIAGEELNIRNNKVVRNKDLYLITITNSFVENFVNMYPYMTQVKFKTINNDWNYNYRKRIDNGKDYFLRPVKSVEQSCEIDTVYNISVENDDSYLVTKDLISVHNCKHLVSVVELLNQKRIIDIITKDLNEWIRRQLGKTNDGYQDADGMMQKDFKANQYDWNVESVLKDILPQDKFKEYMNGTKLEDLGLSDDIIKSIEDAIKGMRDRSQYAVKSDLEKQFEPVKRGRKIKRDDIKLSVGAGEDIQSEEEEEK